MSRGKPKTGKAIACRLTTEADKQFRKMAREKGLTPGQLLKEIALAALV